MFDRVILRTKKDYCVGVGKLWFAGRLQCVQNSASFNIVNNAAVYELFNPHKQWRGSEV